MSTLVAAIGCVLLSVTAQFLIKAGMSSVAVKVAQRVGLWQHGAARMKHRRQ